MASRKPAGLCVDVPPADVAPPESPLALASRLSQLQASPRQPMIERMQASEARRKSFLAWVAPQRLKQAAGSRRRQESYEERLKRAAQRAQQRLAHVRTVASRPSARRQRALQQLQEGRQALAQHLEQQLEDAGRRRAQRQEQQLARLRREHELVLERLAVRREEAPPAEREQRLARIDARLSAASEVRAARAASAAERVASHSSRVAVVSALTRSLKHQQAEDARLRLEQRLQGAQQRRQQQQQRSPQANSKAAPASASSPGSQMQTPTGMPHHQGHAGAPIPSDSHKMPTMFVATPVPSPDGEAEEADEQHQQHLLQLRVEGLRRNVSCRKLQERWRAWHARHSTTRALAHTFVATGVTSLDPPPSQPGAPLAKAASAGPTGSAGPVAHAAAAASSAAGAAVSAPEPFVVVGPGGSGASGRPRPALSSFEQFAATLQAPATIKAATAVLKRLEVRLHARKDDCTGAQQLLRRLFPKASRDRPLERYPARVLLCAFMALRHPEVVFSQLGHRERHLSVAAKAMVAAFEALLARVLDPCAVGGRAAMEDGKASSLLSASPLTAGMRAYKSQQLHSTSSNSTDAVALAEGMRDQQAAEAIAAARAAASLGELLVSFDEAWLRYLDQFVAWKCADAASLEDELVRVAVEMERSVQRKMREATDALVLRSPPATPPRRPHTPSPRAVSSSNGSPTLGEEAAAPAGVPAGVAAMAAHVRSARDLQAVFDQVQHDHMLLRERIAKLSGTQGLARLDAALAAVRASPLSPSSFTSGPASRADSSTASPCPSPRTGAAPPGPPAPGASVAAPPAAAVGTAQPAASPPSPPGTASIATASAQSAAAAPASADYSGAAPPPPTGALSAAPPPSAAQPKAAPTAQRSGLARGFFFGKRPTPMRIPAPPPATSGAAGLAASDASKPSTSGSTVVLPHALQPPSVHTAKARQGDGFSGPAPIAAASPGAGSSLPGRPGVSMEALGNLQMVANLVHNPGFQLPADEAEGAWRRATGEEAEGGAPLALEALEDLGSAEAIVRAVRGKARAVAEAAFYRQLRTRLTMGLESNNLVAEAVPLVAEIGGDLAALVRGPQGTQLAERFSEQGIREALLASSGTGQVATLSALLQVVEALAEALCSYGAPAREEAARVAHAAVKGPLLAALQKYVQQGAGTVQDCAPTEDGDRAKAEARGAAADELAGALAQVLRLLLAQLKLLKTDAANARLAALGRSLAGSAAAPAAHVQQHGQQSPSPAPTTGTASSSTGSDPHHAGIDYLRSRFAEALGLQAEQVDGERQSERLPRTAAWLAQTHQALPALEAYLTSTGLNMDAAHNAAARAASEAGASGAAPEAVPPNMRAGLRATPAAAAAPARVPAAVALPMSVALALPVRLRSPEGLVRAGLVALVTGAAPAAGPSLAETLALDAERIHELQNSVQQLVVTSVALLVAQQVRAQQRAAHAARAAAVATDSAQPSVAVAPWLPADAAATRRRLIAILADPGMRMDDLAVEVCMAGGLDVASTAEQDLAAVAQVRAALQRVLDPASGAFRSLTNAVGAALLAGMLVGPDRAFGPAATTAATLSAPADPTLGAAVGAALSRVGAGGTAALAEVSALCRRLLAVAAVGEAVHGDHVYAPLARTLLQGSAQDASNDAQPGRGPPPPGAPAEHDTGNRGSNSVNELAGAAGRGTGAIANAP